MSSADCLLLRMELYRSEFVMWSEFKGKVAVVTGGAQGIGLCIAELFAERGAKVCVCDVQKNPYFVGNIARKEDLELFCDQVIRDFGHVDYLINNAAPLFKGLPDCSWDEFNYALQVGVTAPYMLTKLFERYFSPGAAIVNISSTRDRMSMPGTECYSAAKGGIAALTHALAVSLSGRVRGNSISPGWIETHGAEYSGADALQHPAGRVGRPEDIAHMVLYLCSSRAGFITGENICIDGGMSRQMIYHGEHGWKLID